MRKVTKIIKKADVIHPRQVAEMNFGLVVLIFSLGLALGLLINSGLN